MRAALSDRTGDCITAITRSLPPGRAARLCGRYVREGGDDTQRVRRRDGRDPVSDDAAVVERLLGRRPQGAYVVVVRHADGSPLVIRNAPLLDDGRPMPTRYWLVGEPDPNWTSPLESAGGVH